MQSVVDDKQHIHDTVKRTHGHPTASFYRTHAELSLGKGNWRRPQTTLASRLTRFWGTRRKLATCANLLKFDQPKYAKKHEKY